MLYVTNLFVFKVLNGLYRHIFFFGYGYNVLNIAYPIKTQNAMGLKPNIQVQADRESVQGRICTEQATYISGIG